MPKKQKISTNDVIKLVQKIKDKAKNKAQNITKDLVKKVLDELEKETEKKTDSSDEQKSPSLTNLEEKLLATKNKNMLFNQDKLKCEKDFTSLYMKKKLTN